MTVCHYCSPTQVAKSLCYVGLIMAAIVFGQIAPSTSSHRPERLVSKKYGFSVVFPRGWFVVGELDPPLCFNFPAERMLPQGELPSRGARISINVRERAEGVPTADRLSEWADHEIEVLHGINVSRSFVAGPPVEGASRALYVLADQPAFGEPGQSHSVAMVLWHFERRDFVAELTFITDDDRGKRYQRTLLEMMRSFKPK